MHSIGLRQNHPYHTHESPVSQSFLQRAVTLCRSILVDIYEEYKQAHPPMIAQRSVPHRSPLVNPSSNKHSPITCGATHLQALLRFFLPCNASIETNTSTREKYKVKTIPTSIESSLS